MEFTKEQAEAYLKTHAVHPGEPAKIKLVAEHATGCTAAAEELMKAATVVYSKQCIEKLQENAPVVAGAPKKAAKKAEEPEAEPEPEVVPDAEPEA